MKQQSKRRAGKPDVGNGRENRRIYQDRHARIIIMRPEHELHLEAEYIYADCVSFQPVHSCKRTADHTFSTVIAEKPSPCDVVGIVTLHPFHDSCLVGFGQTPERDSEQCSPTPC